MKMNIVSDVHLGQRYHLFIYNGMTDHLQVAPVYHAYNAVRFEGRINTRGFADFWWSIVIFTIVCLLCWLCRDMPIGTMAATKASSIFMLHLISMNGHHLKSQR